MKLTSVQNSTNIDLSTLAIMAAEELERLRLGMPTEFNSVKNLAKLINNSFSLKPKGSDSLHRLDHVSVFSRAISKGGNSKTISELVKEAEKVVSQLNLSETGTPKNELTKMVSFCVALSDSAAIYKEEINELKKQVA